MFDEQKAMQLDMRDVSARKRLKTNLEQFGEIVFLPVATANSSYFRSLFVISFAVHRVKRIELIAMNIQKLVETFKNW